MRTIAGAVSSLLLLTALVAACGDDGDGGDRVSPSDEPSCEELSGGESYRYTLNLKLDAPAFEDGPTASPSDPLDAFSEALSALFSNLQLQGAHVAPDRNQVILTFEGEELEWRQIGDQSWVRFGDEWEEQEHTSSDAVLTPAVVCEDIVEDLADSLSGASVEEETVNGVETHHYTINREDITELPELLGGELSDLPEEVNFDIWLAQDGSWPVKIDVSAMDTDENGEPVTLSLEMELSDVGDERVSIEAPEASGDGDEEEGRG